MKLYTISGLGADERVFKHLRLNYEMVHLPWISPLKNESLASYAKRLSVKINTQEDFGLLGVSFGGILAVELCKFLQPKITILVSSAATGKDIPIWFKIVGCTRLLKILPVSSFRLPHSLAAWFFGTKNKELLGHILNDADYLFYKWAINKIVLWKNEKIPSYCLIIQGEKDRILPPKSMSKGIIVKGGHHFMIIDKAEEISFHINKRLSHTT